MKTIQIVQGTDKIFYLNARIIVSDCEDIFEVKKLTDANIALNLRMKQEAGTLDISLTPNANGSYLAIEDAEAGKIKVFLDKQDTSTLVVGFSGVQIDISEGASPNDVLTRIQFNNKLEVIESYF